MSYVLVSCFLSGFFFGRFPLLFKYIFLQLKINLLILFQITLAKNSRHQIQLFCTWKMRSTSFLDRAQVVGFLIFI